MQLTEAQVSGPRTDIAYDGMLADKMRTASSWSLPAGMSRQFSFWYEYHLRWTKPRFTGIDTRCMWFQLRAFTTFIFVFSVSALGQPAATHTRALGKRSARTHETNIVQRQRVLTKPNHTRLVRLRTLARASAMTRVQSQPANRSLYPIMRSGIADEHKQLVSRGQGRTDSGEGDITILFTDRRTPEQIRNYALSRTVLYLPGDPGQVIPVKLIDLPATERLNRLRGKLFELPALP